MTTGNSAPSAAQRAWMEKLGSLAAPVAPVLEDEREGAGADLVELKISPESAKLEGGGRLQYKATGKPADGPERDVTAEVVWNSQDRAVVAIGLKNGLAVALGAGSTTINARLDRGVEGDLVAAAAVSVVSGPAPVRLIAITVTPERATLKGGEGKQFQALGKLSNGKSEDVTTEVRWISGGPEVEIDNKGGFAIAQRVTGEKTVTILAKHPEDPGTFGSATVTVKAGQAPPPSRPVLKSIDLRPPAPTGEVGNLFLFLADGTFTDGSRRDVTKRVAFSSSDDSVLRFSGTNVARALSAGRAKVSAMDAATGVVGSTDVTVKGGPTPPPNEPVLKSIELRPPDPTGEVGNMFLFVADGTFADGSRRDVTKRVAFSSSDDTVLRFGGTNVARALSAGRAKVTAKDAATGVVGSTDVTVKGGDTPPAPVAGFVSRVSVTNRTDRALLRGKHQAVRGSYEKEPPASIRPGETATFVLRSGEDRSTSGFVTWEADGALDDSWTISFGFSGALNRGEAAQSLDGEHFRAVEPVVRDKDFVFALEPGSPTPPPVEGFVSRVTVTNRTDVALLRGKHQAIKGSYEKEPPASIRPGETVAFAIRSGKDGSTAGFVPWEVDGATDESWTLSFGFSGALSRGEAEQSLRSQRFRGVEPVVRDKDFAFALERGSPVPPPPPPPPPQPEVAVSCLVTVLNDTRSVLTLLDPQTDRGNLSTQPRPVLKPGESTTFVHVQTPRETEPSKLGCKASIFWEISPPVGGTWTCSWENLVAESNKASGEVITPEKGVLQSLAQAGQGDENVPFRFTLRERAGPAR